MYCPWDVLNFADDLLADPQARPKAYWAGTSSNDILKRLLKRAGNNEMDMLAALVGGGEAPMRITENLTYSEVDEGVDNLWSLMFLTGYLTETSPNSGVYRMPNEEVRTIAREGFWDWIGGAAGGKGAQEAAEALWAGDADGLKAALDRVMMATISYHDYSEAFYHAFLAGVLVGARQRVASNREAGTGRCDILVFDARRGLALAIEAKVAGPDEDLGAAAARAIAQARDKVYAWQAEYDGYHVLTWGIAFQKKACKALCDI
jgi:hypothetical protein